MILDAYPFAVLVVVGGVVRERRDDTTRTVTTYDETGTLTPSTPEAPNPRPYTADENAAADARAAAEAVRAVEATLTTDTTSDLKQVEAAIAKLATLLGPTTTVGSIRAIMGATTDPAGTTSLRALKAQSNTSVITAASIKALIGLVIDALQLVIDERPGDPQGGPPDAPAGQAPDRRPHERRRGCRHLTA